MEPARVRKLDQAISRAIEQTIADCRLGDRETDASRQINAVLPTVDTTPLVNGALERLQLLVKERIGTLLVQRSVADKLARLEELIEAQRQRQTQDCPVSPSGVTECKLEAVSELEKALSATRESNAALKKQLFHARAVRRSIQQENAEIVRSIDNGLSSFSGAVTDVASIAETIATVY